MMLRLFRRRRREMAPTKCECGNYPLDEEDIVNDGRCLCCRTGHLFYHDDRVCRRCGCPFALAWPDRPVVRNS